MCIIDSARDYFRGTHKGAEIMIERDHEMPDSEFYIIVRARNDGLLYDGWAPEEVRTIADAKKEAVRGACLDEPREKA